MSTPTAELLAVTAVAFAVSAVCAVLAIWLGLRLGISDAPGGRRQHARVTSRLGALPIFAGFVAAAALAQSFAIPTEDALNERVRLGGLMLGALLMFVAGVLDDRMQLSPRTQFAWQGAAACVAIASLIFIERFRNPFGAGAEVVLPVALYVIVSLLWHMGMMNTVNFLDGVDGLAGTVGLIASAFTALHMLRESQFSVAAMPLALCGALAGFLIFNLPPARLFMGGGAPMLGFMLSCVGIMAGAKLALLLLVMGLPIADVALQIVARATRGQSPMRGDRGHLHFRLKDSGWSAGRIVALYSAACVVLGALAMAPVPPVAKLIVIGVVFAVALAVLRRLSAKQQTRV